MELKPRTRKNFPQSAEALDLFKQLFGRVEMTYCEENGAYHGKRDARQSMKASEFIRIFSKDKK
jgi:hypothetical protein